LLWLEGGKPPVKGQIEVILETYTCFILERLVSEGVFYSPLLHLSSFCKIATEGRDFKILRVGQIEISSLSTLNDLLAEVAKMDQFSNIPPQHIRLWQNERILKKHNSTLRKQNINENCRLTTQILSHPDPIIEKGGNSSLLYIHKRDSIQKRFQQLGEYAWPGGALEDLLIDISKFVDIPVEFMMFASYELYYDRWITYYNGVSEPDRIIKYLEEKNKKIEENKKNKNKKENNL